MPQLQIAVFIGFLVVYAVLLTAAFLPELDEVDDG